MLTWIQDHSFLLLQWLTFGIFVIPIGANVSIRFLRRYSSSPTDRMSKAANWIAAKAPLILEDLVRARDAVLHPEQLMKIQDATNVVKALAVAKPDDSEIAIASARLTAAVEGKPTSVKAPPTLVVLVLGLVLTGCAGTPPAKMVSEITESISVVDPALHAIYEAEQERCLRLDPKDQDACIAKTREVWRPIIDALLRIREAWCQLQPSNPGCAS